MSEHETHGTDSSTPESSTETIQAQVDLRSYQREALQQLADTAPEDLTSVDLSRNRGLGKSSLMQATASHMVSEIHEPAFTATPNIGEPRRQ